MYHRHVKSFCRLRPSTALQGDHEHEGSRIIQACKKCRLRKLKCNGVLPCARCARRREECSYSHDSAGITSTTTAPGVIVLPVDQRTDLLPADSWPEHSYSDVQDSQTSARDMPLQESGGTGLSDTTWRSLQPPVSDQSATQTLVVSTEPSLQIPMAATSQPGNNIPSNNGAWPAMTYAHEDELFANCVGNLFGPVEWPTFGNLNDMSWLQSSEVSKRTPIPRTPADVLQYSDPFLFDWNSRGFPGGELIESPTVPRLDVASDTAGLQAPAADAGASNVSANVTQSTTLSQQITPTWLKGLRSSVGHYDKEILNYFLEKFFLTTTGAFPTFESFKIESSTLPEVILAMAAVGGLFSRIDKSFDISLSMYMEARRLVLGRVSRGNPLSRDQHERTPLNSLTGIS